MNHEIKIIKDVNTLAVFVSDLSMIVFVDKNKQEYKGKTDKEIKEYVINRELQKWKNS